MQRNILEANPDLEIRVLAVWFDVLDVAARRRAIADLPTPAPADQHLAHHLRAAADIVEQQAGDT